MFFSTLSVCTIMILQLSTSMVLCFINCTTVVLQKKKLIVLYKYDMI